ncbi:MAG TPA: triose-phosphate isomerase [Dehalococcoidia bacterium]
MSRTPIVAGNWKMNTNAASARELVEAIKGGSVDAVLNVEKVLCPPFIYLPLVAGLAAGTSLKVGAQDMHWEEKGAFTGEVSAAMLGDFATHVIIGHSERRAYFGETDETVNRKVKAALAHGLVPIICVGETGAERQAGHTHNILRRQVRGALQDVALPAGAVIAYEPVWAIGTGVAATPADANDAIAFIRREVAALQGEATASAVRILYGGSVTPANIADFVAQPEVDGGLVGGASLVAESFIEMVRAVAATAK